MIYFNHFHSDALLNLNEDSLPQIILWKHVASSAL